jgi:hypothetical protein
MAKSPLAVFVGVALRLEVLRRHFLDQAAAELQLLARYFYAVAFGYHQSRGSRL